MPAAPTTMRHCPDCKAPNPASRTDCYACGQRLDRVVPGAPAPGERTFPCRNCDSPVPFSATSCPQCGRLVRPAPEHLDLSLTPSTTVANPAADYAARSAAAAFAVPPGWQAEPLPDGTVRLQRTTWGRLNQGSAGAGIALLVGALFVMQMFFGIGRHGAYVGARADGASPLAWPLYVAVGALLLGGIGGLVCFLCGTYELRAGPSLLEARWRLGKWYRMRRLESAVLRIETRDYYHSRGGHTIRRALRAENLGAHVTLDSDSRSGDLIGAAIEGLVRPTDGPAALGAYLSHLTGFPLVDPAHGRF